MKDKKNGSHRMFEGEKYLSLQDAAKLTPYSQEYLSLLARKRRIAARKLGRNWYITREAIKKYLAQQAVPLTGGIYVPPEPTASEPLPVATLANNVVVEHLTKLSDSVSSLTQQFGTGRSEPDHSRTRAWAWWALGVIAFVAPLWFWFQPNVRSYTVVFLRRMEGATTQSPVSVTNEFITLSSTSYSLTQLPGMQSFPLGAIRGSQGPKGDTGPKGEKGDRGVAGEPGTSGANLPASQTGVVTGPPGYQIGAVYPTASYPNSAGTIAAITHFGAQDFTAQTVSVTGTTTLATLIAGPTSLGVTGASSLSVSGGSSFSSVLVSSDLEVAGTASISQLSASKFTGSGLTDCAGSSQTLHWDSATGQFACGTVAAGSIQMREGEGVFSTVTSISFNAAHFDLATTASEALLSLDWANGPASRSIAQTITGAWMFTAASNQFSNTLEIGTASVSNLLVTNAGNTGMTLKSTSAIGTDGQFTILTASTSDRLDIRRGTGTLSETLLSIASSGNVGIGTTSPDSKLDVSGSILASSSDPSPLWLNRSDSGNNASIRFSNTQGSVYFGITSVEDFAVGPNADLRTSPWLTIASVSGNVGIGTLNQSSRLHVYENTTTTGVETGLTIEQAGTGDALLQYLLTGARRWVTGADNSDSDKFKFSYDTDLNDNVAMTLDTSGNVGIGTTTPAAQLEVLKAGGVAEFRAVRLSNSTSQVNANVALELSAAGNTKPAKIVAVAPGGNDQDLAFYTTDNLVQSALMYLQGNGNVGIGSTGPEQKLDVAGNILASTSGNVDLILRSSTATSDDGKFTIRSTGASDRLEIMGGTTPTNLVTVASSGNVGIGTTSPTLGRLQVVVPNVAGVNNAGLAMNGTFTNTTASTRMAAISLQGVAWNDTSAGSILNAGVDGIMALGGTAGNQSVAENWDVRVATAGDYPNYGSYNPIIIGGKYLVRTIAGFNGTIAGEVVGGLFQVQHSAGAGTISGPMAGIEISAPGYVAGGTVSGLVYGARIANQGNAAWATSYGIYLDAQSGSTANAYSIYSNGGTNYFAGNVGIGTTAPDTKLDVAGNILASTSGNVSLTLKSTSAIGTDGQFTILTASTSDRLDIRRGTGTLSETLLSIASSGNVGIGTTDISTKLEVAGTASVSKLLVDLTGTQTTFAVCHPNDGQTVSQELVDCNTPVGDYMEMYPTDTTVQEGDIVMASERVVATTNGQGTVPVLVKATDGDRMLGIISIASQAGDFNSIGHNIPAVDNPKPLALVGRVQVRVTTENGDILPGDRIALSTIPGTGAKASSAGQIIGIALEAAHIDGAVLVFVNPGYWAPSGSTDAGGLLASGSADAVFLANQDSWNWASIMDRMKFWFRALWNITVDNGIIKTVKGMFTTVELQTGATIHDSATGEPYCVSVVNGQLTTTAGECGTESTEHQAPSTDSPTPSATPNTPPSPASSSLEFSPTPLPVENPASTSASFNPTPNVSPSITPEITPEPSISVSPEPNAVISSRSGE